MKRLRYESGKIDSVDARIMDALFDNARISHAELGRMIGLSPPSVAERIKRLEEAGIIEGYTISINPKALGYHIACWLRIRPIPGQLEKVAKLLQTIPEVVECDRITGEDCFLARAYVSSIEDMQALIDKIIPFAMTNSSIIQSSPVKKHLPLIQQDM